MTPINFHLIHAFIEWIYENNMTPNLIINSMAKGLVIPTSFDTDKKIALSLHPDSISNYSLTHEAISFNATYFSNNLVYIPLSAVLFVESRDNGLTMPIPIMYSPIKKEKISDEFEESSDDNEISNIKNKKKSTLKLL